MGLRVGLVLAIMTIFLTASCFAAIDSIHNVKDYGAVGDGKADDTAAIRKAIEATGLGGTVRFPMGVYKISGTLNLEAVHLVGNISGGFPSDADVLPGIIVTHTDGASSQMWQFLEYPWSGFSIHRCQLRKAN